MQKWVAGEDGNATQTTQQANLTQRLFLRKRRTHAWISRRIIQLATQQHSCACRVVPCRVISALSSRRKGTNEK